MYNKNEWKLIVKVLLFITAPIWCVPYLIIDIIKEIWMDISKMVDRRMK